MSSLVNVTLDGERRRVPRGTPAGEVLNGARARDVVAVRVNGKVVDLSRPLEEDAVLEPIRADSPEGLDVLRHSTAHLMAQAVQSLYPGTQVTIGPTIEDGFFYDFAPPAPFTVDDLPKIEARMRELAKADLKVERIELPRAEAIERFAQMGEHYKVEILRGIPDERVSIYRQGDWMDLCRGPHVPSTGHLRAFKLTSVAGAYWRGDERNPMLSRIYGTAFASAAALEEHLKLLELARTRDHRKLGREMGLFVFDPIAPGQPFYLPKGMVIFNALVDYVRRLYRRYGFDEVITPQIFRNELWHTSGHWENFRENMFLSPDPESGESAVDTGPEGWRKGYGVKPMNCPGHTFVYRAEKRSYRDLPLRVAEFSRLHRAERSGVLHGLTRVRVMSQDDAHIFCTAAQIAAEIDINLRMVRDVYEALGFEHLESKVATMPEKHLGSEELWRTSEAILGEALTRNGLQWEINPGEGAFYGPKIEVYVPDALKRRWQLATIQLDYNMPERFGLTFTNAAGAEERPAMIHRAILGSLERFIGVLLEHTGGVLPFWLAPEQTRVLSLSEKVESYAAEVAGVLKREGFRAAADLRNEKLGFKVRAAELAKVPYMVVVGEREAAGRAISLRRLRGAKNESMPLENLVALLKSEPLPG
ncbi:MAG TPA: threonine--tRNA ligase [Candidatus Binataceae bacterium]|jgi:threonyl-tRNA synthetase|nr:threonine--tRNA ligase [Candidatus Binataceae bacterium]